MRSALMAAAVVCVGLIWNKFVPLSADVWRVLLGAAGVALLLGAAVGMFRPVSRLAAARIADVRLGLEDRLSSACEFAAHAEPTPFMLAHVAETSRHLDGIRPAEAVPLQLQKGFRLLGVAAVLMGLLAMLPEFKREVPKAPTPTRVTLPALSFAGERTVDAMLVTLGGQSDARLAEVMRDLKRLYTDLRTQELSREEALARVGEAEANLAELEDQRSHGRTAHTWRREIEKALSAKGAVLRKHPATESLGRSMAELKLDEASRESRSLADGLSRTPPTLKLTPEQSKVLSELFGKAAAESERTLDVLSKDLADAARHLSLGDMKKLAESLTQMARELEKLKEETETLKGLARMDEELEELKEIVNALAPDGEGRWTLAAGGAGRQAMGVFQLEGVESPEDERGKAQPGVGSSAEGPGTGGEPTRIDGKYVTRTLSGTWGDGASLIEIVRGAAAEGVVTTAYAEAAETAARVAEDAVHNEDIPLGYRFYIKRYFQLIRPPRKRAEERP